MTVTEPIPPSAPSPSAGNSPVLEALDVVKEFPVTGGLFGRTIGQVHAVSGVSMSVDRGETLGIVGESGCGKSTFGRVVLRLLTATAGTVKLGGQDTAKMPNKELRRRAQMVFQDPYASLNPRMTVGNIVGEPLEVHDILRGKERRDKVMELLEVVGLNPYFVNRYPHEFSGGQRQRIGVARALAVKPDFIVCDEPISALDVSIQAQIINLLEELQSKFGLTYLFIAHDLSVVRHISDRVAVMYLGKIVELTTRDELYNNPLHPYTKALLSAVPIPDPVVEEKRRRIILEGDVPSPANPPSGCHFRTRCSIKMDICAEQDPAWRDVGGDHWVACHRA